MQAKRARKNQIGCERYHATKDHFNAKRCQRKKTLHDKPTQITSILSNSAPSHPYSPQLPSEMHGPPIFPSSLIYFKRHI